MSKKTAANQKGAIPFIVLSVIVIVVVATLVYMRMTESSGTKVASLPPVSERTNPEPTGTSTVYISKVTPGTSLTVEKATLSSDGYIYVYKEVSGKRSVIGKSSMLTKGDHTNVSIKLTSVTKDGDIVYATVMTKDGAAVKDENGNAIEMLLNVGMMMGHYENEY